MKRLVATARVLCVVGFLIVAVDGAVAESFPFDRFMFTVQVGPGWSETTEADLPDGRTVYSASHEEMVIEMYVSGDPIAPDDHLDLFAEDIEDVEEIEFFGQRVWDGYQEQYREIPALAAVADGEFLLARADFPDFYGVLTVIRVPLEVADEHATEMGLVLFPE